MFSIECAELCAHDQESHLVNAYFSIKNWASAVQNKKIVKTAKNLAISNAISKQLEFIMATSQSLFTYETSDHTLTISLPLGKKYLPPPYTHTHSAFLFRCKSNPA